MWRSRGIFLCHHVPATRSTRSMTMFQINIRVQWFTLKRVACFSLSRKPSTPTELAAYTHHTMQLDTLTTLLDMPPIPPRQRSYSVDSTASSLPELIPVEDYQSELSDPWHFIPPTIPASLTPPHNHPSTLPDGLEDLVNTLISHIPDAEDEEKVPLLRLDFDSSSPSTHSQTWTPSQPRRPHPTELQLTPTPPPPSQTIPPLTLPNSPERDLTSHIPLMVESLSTYPLSSAFAACFEEQLARLNEQCLDCDGVLRWDEKVNEEVVTLERAIDQLRRIVPVGR